MTRQKGAHFPYPISFPPNRPLKVYAFDPSIGSMLGNILNVAVPYEPLEPGPVGERFAVVDYDGGAKTYYSPVNLDDQSILMRGGLDPTEFDPRFHQQMVYAVASETLARFEAALGRRVHWRRAPKRPAVGQPNRLYLYPHAMVDRNAFYSPDAHGILFGYFRADQDSSDSGNLLPGQIVFTCLSHDVIAHEVTHAVIDGIRSHFTEATNIDVPAFHEAFADLAALFRHFSHQDALLDAIQRTGGRLYAAKLSADSPSQSDGATIQSEIAANNPLIELARQFGQSTGMRGALRSALGVPPNSKDIETVAEPHARGSILVAAVFDAFFAVYLRRANTLFRIFRAGGGSANPIELPMPLATKLAEEASSTSEMFFAICARALDYCPPVNITFGDFLRAIITADTDLYPVDSDGVRDAIMQAFRLRGILPTDAQFFSQDALCWPPVEPDALPPVSGLLFGDPNGLTRAEQDHNGDLLRKYARDNAKRLGFKGKDRIAAASFHPMFRIVEDGSLKVDMVVELVQTRQILTVPANPRSEKLTVRSGVTLIIAQPPLHAGVRAEPTVRFAIGKHPTNQEMLNQHSALLAQGLITPEANIDFCLLHGL